MGQLGHGARNGCQARALAAAVRHQLRARRKKAARVGVGHGREDSLCGAAFHHRAAIHHQHAVGVLRDHAQVVRDQDERHAALGHQVADEVQNLLLHGHIQRRGGLVGNQQVGPAGQRHGDGDALALPARELVRIGIQAPRGIGNAHALQQGQGLAASRCTAHAAVQPQGLGHLVPNAVHGVQRRHGLLEHHADAVAAQAAQRAVVQPHQLLPIQKNAATGLRGVGQQAHERQGGE